MFRFLVRLFAVVGLLVVLAAIGLGALYWRMAERGPAVPDRIVLDLDLDRELIEHVPADPLAEILFGRETSLRDVVDALDRARSDPRVAGVVARLGADRFDMAAAQELRQAVLRFRESGRFALAYADSFGEFGPANSAYYAATGFDEIWMQPVGIWGVTGIAAQVPFLNEALERFGLRPEMEQRREYKSFANTFTETGFTEAHRAMTESLVEDLTGQLVATIAEGRGLAPEQVAGLIDRAPLLDREALEARLLDRLGYRDEVRASAAERAGAGAGAIELDDYLGEAGGPHAEGAGIALIYGVGSIAQGESGADPLFGGPSIGSDTVVRAFEEAIRDPEIRGILFRIDSGGGSAVASESIRRAVARARDAGKPVVVSMGSAAASGGYWIALAADEIVAQPATLTGSIGVLAGKIVTEELWDELGVNWGVVARSRNAGMWSSLSGYSESERSRLDALLDDIYGAFTARVAEARGLPAPAVDDVARGRVWTGNQAKALGLVDTIGGFDTALSSLRRRLGLPAEAALRIDEYPLPASRFERLLKIVAVRSGIADAARLSALLRPVLGGIEGAGTPAASRNALQAPPTGLDGLR
jgi:protease IV